MSHVDPIVSQAETHQIEMLKGIIQNKIAAGEDVTADQAQLDQLNERRVATRNEETVNAS